MAQAVVLEEEVQTFGARLAGLRALIRADAVEIRAASQALRAACRGGDAAASSMMAALHHQRQRARARHLLSGLLRGRSFAQMESNHPDGDPRIRWALRAALAESGFTVPELNEEARRHVE